MEQAAYQSRGGEFSELKAYLIAKLLWNPEANTNEVIDDFIHGYYGRSGSYIREYFNLAQNLVSASTHMKIGIQPSDKLFTDEFVNKSMQLFSEALKVADNEVIVDRVQMAALPLYYLNCLRNPVAARNSGLYAKTLSIISKEGITYLAESGNSLERFKNWVENGK